MSYVTDAPSAQNIVDLFQGEWLSNLPGLVTIPGGLELFHDERILWAENALGGFEDQTILELGPFEGGHSFMLDTQSARSVVSIEANTKSFLKCLCVKEILCLRDVNFLLGDFVKYLQTTKRFFDTVLACGVLYHMEDPLELLRLISTKTNKVFLWTHYYDEEIIRNNPALARKFEKPEIMTLDGVVYTVCRQEYQEVFESKTFCGGPAPQSRWLTRGGILQALGQLGFGKLEIGFDTLDHPHGPAFAICAQK